MNRTLRSLALALLVLVPAALVRADDDDDKTLLFGAAPTSWTVDTTKPLMGRKLAYNVPAAEGDADPAHVTVHFFGGMGGSVEENIKRWCSQFKDANGDTFPREKAKPEKLEIAGLKASIVELFGTYQPPMFAPDKTPKPGWRLLAAILETPGGPWFVRLVGPDKTIAKEREGFTSWLKTAHWDKPGDKKADDKKPEEKKPEERKPEEKKPDGK